MVKFDEIRENKIKIRNSLDSFYIIFIDFE